MSDEGSLAVNEVEPQQVRALKDWKGEELDDLTFNKGDVITINKKDGAGWASGSLDDGSHGWFPMDCVELVHESAVANVGVITGESALDAFIKDAKEKKPGVVSLPLKRVQGNVNRNNSLQEFLATRPMKEQLVEQNILPSTETTEQIEAAQKRLLKLQKKRKKERADALIEQLRRGWAPENPFKLTEDQIDRIVLSILLDIPVSKQKYHFSSFDDVFNGATLLQNLKVGAHRVAPAWEKGISTEDSAALAQNLLDRNIIVDVVDSSKKKFKAKLLYQLQSVQPEYSVLNMDKIYTGSPVNAYELSIQLAGEIVEVMKQYLPDFEKLRKSKELKAFALHTTALQSCSLVGLSSAEQKIFFINVYNAMVLFSHAKFSPPKTALDRRFLYEHCSVYTNQLRYSIQDLEKEATQFATKADPLVYFCLSDCTKSTPATYLFSTEDYDTIKVYATRHFLHRSLIFDSSNYEVLLPKLFQRVWKSLGYTKEELIDLIKPYISKEQREELQNILDVGNAVEVKFQQYTFEPSYIFEETSPLSPR